jgi:hypothetical protein
MDEFEQIVAVEAPELMQGLRSLGEVKAPAGLLPAVLTRIGLGDAYWHLETAIGPVFVAYNDKGISALMRAQDAAEFERAFRLRFDRRVYPASQPPADLVRAVTQQLSGGGRSKLRFDLHGLSDFERAVLLKALEIPRGEVRLDRAGDRSPQGGAGGRHGAGGQPHPAAHPLPPGGTQRRAHRQLCLWQ